jgi:pimeloyl-ACP methyl ester carboxylesterase
MILMRDVIKIHGWPDLSMGWRYQISSLLDLGLRVVVPDMMGYGGTVCIQLLALLEQHAKKFRMPQKSLRNP